jgi:hypothetical protein
MQVVRTIVVAGAAALSCASQEAVRVQMEVELDASTVTDTTNDLGWTVTLTGARVAVTDLQFTIQGEMHEATAWLEGWLVRRAWAHPGHYAGGNVTGELLGDFVLDWFGRDGDVLGTAELLTGDYNGFNFLFRQGSEADGLAGDDPLLGHAAQFTGTAQKDGVLVTFSAVLDVNEGTQMVGAPFELTVEAGADTSIRIQLEATDPVESRSMFDGIDFGTLDDDGDGDVRIEPGSEAHNILVRTIQSHVHYNAEAR